MLNKLIHYILHADGNKKINLLLISSFFIPIAMLLSAFYLQYFQNLPPCDLCITQRWFHVLIIIYSLLIFIILKIKSISFNLIILGLLVVWLFSGIAGMYHFGIEIKLWSGPEKCSSGIDLSKDLFQYLMSKSPVKCDEVMYRILGLSLAGWNAVISILISILMTVLLIKKDLLKI